MRKLIILCALSVAVMHFNQDLNPMYLVGLIGFATTSNLIANRLDKYGRTGKNDREHLQ